MEGRGARASSPAEQALKQEMQNLDKDIRSESAGSKAVAPPPATPNVKPSSSFWWGCSPIQYLDTEASDKAYLDGRAGRPLQLNCMAAKQEKEDYEKSMAAAYDREGGDLDRLAEKF